MRSPSFIWQLVAFLLLPLIVFAQDAKKVLKCGWYPWDPYQYLFVRQDVKRLTGLDVQLVRAVFAQMGYEVTYEEVSWKQHQLDVQNGVRDIAAGAFKNPERAEYAYFSVPYRKETDVLYIRKGEASRYPFRDVRELLQRFQEKSFRLGVINGFYYGPDIMQFINDPANTQRIVTVPDDVANFENLLSHRIDGFIVDRLVGSTLAWRYGWQLAVEELSPPVYSEDIHVLFSKKTTNPEMVEAFNRSLEELKRDGQYARIVREYLFPVLLGATVAQRWFFTIDIIGTIAFAISGILLARQGKYSLFGAFVLASLPAVGGGLMRDLVVNRETVGVLTNPAYVVAVIVTVLTGYLGFHLAARTGFAAPRGGISGNDADDWIVRKVSLNTAIAFFDALGLAAFTVIGVVVAVESRSNPLWLWGPLLAALTGAGGGIVRDVIRADANNPFLKGTFYAEVALVWGLMLSLFLMWYANFLDYKPSEISLAVVATLIGALVTRMAVFHLRIKSPMY
ncbi:MAG TPA: transporter substrate-binding domain-containing protein [Candidatus Binatia bacterium]|nr:transporter substrate-binding domain-containing protein [Candidatus Binatia bacterium]